jgi:hypothetical protein
MNAEPQLSKSPVQGWRQLNDGAIEESEGQRRVDRRPTGVEEGKRVTVTVTVTAEWSPSHLG